MARAILFPMLLLALIGGCVTAPAKLPPPVVVESSIDQVKAETPIVPTVKPTIKPISIRESTELDLNQLLAAIDARNPTIQQMWQASAALSMKSVQARSLDDPMLGLNVAPGSGPSANTSFAARAEISQKIPYPGKRLLRSEIIQWEGFAAREDVTAMRQKLAEAGQNSYADWFLIGKSLEVNVENLKLLTEYRANAETRYRNGQGPQQDLLQADVELARQQERAISLERARKVTQAKINTLMHEPIDVPLPPAREIKVAPMDLNLAELNERALANRPDLKALQFQLNSDEAALALAEREYKPDVEVLAAYDGFWQGANGRPLQWQVGARINLPVQRERRAAAVGEMKAKLAQRRAEISRMTDQIMFEVQEAHEQWQESRKIVELYEKTVLPAAVANVKEARASYTNGKVPFLNLIEAQRNATMLRDRYYESVADVIRRQGALERAARASEPMPRNPLP